MSFLESYEAFKANGGVYTINKADQMLAYNNDEPWHAVTQKLAHFAALGGQTVPASYVAAYNIANIGNCFTYAMGLEIDQAKLKTGSLMDANTRKLTRPGFYNIHTLGFGYKTTDMDCPKTREKINVNIKTKEIVEQLIKDCRFEYNPKNVTNYVPVIYMIRKDGEDFHFCLPHTQAHKNNYDVGLSCRDGFQQDVVGFGNLNQFAHYQQHAWPYHYDLQPDILFLDKPSFAKLATIPEHEKRSSDKFTTRITPNPNVMFLQNVLLSTRQQLDTLQFNTVVHTMDGDQPVLKIA